MNQPSANNPFLWSLTDSDELAAYELQGFNDANSYHVDGVINANDPFNFSDVLSRTPTYPARSLIDPALDRADSAAGNNSTGDRTQPNNTQSDSRQPQSAQDSSGGASPASSASQMACSNGDCVQRLATVKIITDLATSFGKGKDCNQVELGGQAVCQKCGASFAGTLKRTNRASR